MTRCFDVTTRTRFPVSIASAARVGGPPEQGPAEGARPGLQGAIRKLSPDAAMAHVVWLMADARWVTRRAARGTRRSQFLALPLSHQSSAISNPNRLLVPGKGVSPS